VTGPTFLVAGGARCGTTGLVEGLREHPDVALTSPKEPHYFAFHRTGAAFTAPGDEHTINRVSVTDLDRYLALYPSAKPDGTPYTALGEGSVSTLYYPEESIPEILRVNPAMRIVVLLREPVERAHSAYGYMRARGLEPEDDFLTAVHLEEERKAAGWHHIWHYTGMSRYADSLAAFAEAFPREQLGVWFYDDLNRDYASTVAEVLTHIGVPATAADIAEVPRVNVSGQPRSQAFHELIKRATGNATVRTAVKRVTSYRFREAVRRRALRSDDLPPGAREELEPLFADDLARLRALLPSLLPPGRELPGWVRVGAEESARDGGGAR
jgi:Sulfotransferase domain